MLCYAAEYRPSMTWFNRFSNYAKRDFNEANIGRLHGIFEAFMTSAANVDPSTFRLAERFSIAIFEAALYGQFSDFMDNRQAS